MCLNSQNKWAEAEAGLGFSLSHLHKEKKYLPAFCLYSCAIVKFKCCDNKRVKMEEKKEGTTATTTTKL